MITDTDIHFASQYSHQHFIYIDDPKMDWSMDDGLYSRFQDWKLECELILDGELAEIAEPGKVNTLI